MGDVVRDVPRELASRGDQVHVVVPSYGRLHQKAEFRTSLSVRLRGQEYELELYEATPKKKFEGITHYVLHHPEIEAGDIHASKHLKAVSLERHVVD